MSDDVKKAVCLCVFTQEQTKGLISLDAKNLKLAELKAGEPCAKEWRHAQ